MSGFPIASGVIEGACRHLINDRLDITGARWGLIDAESILKLRSIKSSGDFESFMGISQTTVTSEITPWFQGLNVGQ